MADFCHRMVNLFPNLAHVELLYNLSWNYCSERSQSPPAFDKWGAWPLPLASHESSYFRLKRENEWIWQRNDMWNFLPPAAQGQSLQHQVITLVDPRRLLETQFNCWILRANINIFKVATCTHFGRNEGYVFFWRSQLTATSECSVLLKQNSKEVKNLMSGLHNF